MSETTIIIDQIEPLDLYGAANVNIDRINSKFPELKIVVRGHVIKLSGGEQHLERYRQRLDALIAYVGRYGHLSTRVIDQLYDNSPLTEVSQDNSIDINNQPSEVLVYGNSGLTIKARTANQQRLVDLYDKNDLMFAIGPAGSGKTYTAIALAVRALRNKEVKRIILTRPAVEAGEKLGFLPGDMKEKLDPYLQPLYDALGDMIPAKKLAQYMDEGVVQIAPLAYMRGRTLDHAFVILDEAQNTTIEQLKMFLTRMGRSAKFIVTGDITQIDLPRKSDSGLRSAIKQLSSIEGIAFVEFAGEDILRHRLVRKIVEAFDQQK